jgi:hypothetical protein
MEATMSSKQQPKNGSTRCIAIDVRANDLVHIGTDTRGHNHYHDRQRDRIIVVDADHDEYEADDSVLVRRSLVVDADDVVHVQYKGPTEDIVRYLRFVAEHVDEREWVDVHVTVIDDELLATLGGGA